MGNYRKQISELSDKQDAKGAGKYGIPLEQSSAEISERLSHLAEELMDGLRYALWSKDALEKECRQHGPRYHFRRTKFVGINGINEQLEHIRSEIREIEWEIEEGTLFSLLGEVIDLAHSVETLIRILQEKYNMDIEKARAAVVAKNKERGYYDCI